MQSAKQDWELTVAQIMNSLLPNSDLKKVGKTTRPLRYDLNQTPYDYTVKVRNRSKALDLIDRVPDELWNEVCDIVLETWIKTIPMEKKCIKAKWLSGEALQIAVKRRESEVAQSCPTQIPYDYTVEVRNRFKGLDLDR